MALYALIETDTYIPFGMSLDAERENCGWETQNSLRGKCRAAAQFGCIDEGRMAIACHENVI